jgi:hypothetical protein
MKPRQVNIVAAAAADAASAAAVLHCNTARSSWSPAPLWLAPLHRYRHHHVPAAAAAAAAVDVSHAAAGHLQPQAALQHQLHAHVLSCLQHQLLLLLQQQVPLQFSALHFELPEAPGLLLLCPALSTALPF